jgi:muramoyltetrapeptide carboxypeptidase LdcA involved in peptidoglycan recycling
MNNIRVIAFSRSLKMICDENISLAAKKLESLGYNVSFSKNCNICDSFISSSVKSRIYDFNDALKDDNVDIILSVLGGYNCNQLLDYIDYNLIKKYPKFICGYSDITAILNAIYAKTNVTTYLGPNFHSFAMKQGIDDTVKLFEKMVNGKKYVLLDPKVYSSDKWYDDQENRIFIANKGLYVISEGKTKGKIVGGNLCTFNLLQGTEYMPSLKDKILFLEGDSLVGAEFPYEFDRNLQSLIHQKDFNKVRGIIIGRTQTATKMNITKWKKILCTKPELRKIPIIINANFGHTTPTATIPIGGICIIDTTKEVDKIIIGG